jgi:hypothetical protein
MPAAGGHVSEVKTSLLIANGQTSRSNHGQIAASVLASVVGITAAVFAVVMLFIRYRKENHGLSSQGDAPTTTPIVASL